MENLNDLLVFVKVVERCGISAAASVLDISPSLVSRRLRYLEQSMGVQLLNRSTRHISLTDAGRLFYESCSQALASIDAARLSATSLSSVPYGILRVHSAYGVGQSWVSRAITVFKQEFPDVSVDLVIGSDHENLMRDGYDLIIKTSDLQDSSLDHRDFGVVRHFVVAAPGYLRRCGRPKDPRDLTNHECLLQYGWRAANEWFFKDGNSTYAVKVDGTFKSTNAVVLRHAAASGLGITRLPEYVLDGGRSDGLEIIFDDCVASTRLLRAFFPRSMHVPAKISAFLDCLGRVGPCSKGG
jgi:DNA-binding transcriptional LysR family regulator